ncbi:MAG TPA: FliI/YscN family ATPase [Steroidobacteraceae bacterium]|nr:FliI/YscN family ATPase [Steroidobacteraceae bacterium]
MSRAGALAEQIRAGDWVRRIGRIVRFIGLTVESTGPDARVGEICEIHARGGRGVTPAEVVGFSEQRVLLMPYGDLQGIEIGSEVIATGRSADVGVGDELLGRVIDGFGRPLDETPLAEPAQRYSLYPPPINPLQRGMVREVLETGIRAIDTLLTLGRGQRIGIFAGSGVGKSTVLGMLAREVRADVSVIALIGERGREVRAFVEEGLSDEARKRSVVVAATSDQPPLVRRRAAFLATAIAEHFRDAGMNVCLTMDSITRVAMAQREIGLAAGELPTARGYTPSVFTLLPRLLERGGVRNAGGSLTALYTVLVEGDDVNEPISDSVRSILDGHIVLSRDIAHRGRYPAIDIPRSISRLATALVTDKERALIAEVVKLLATYESSRDLIEVGAYRAGTTPAVDRAIALNPVLEQFLAQKPEESEARGEACARLERLLAAETQDSKAKLPRPAVKAMS